MAAAQFSARLISASVVAFAPRASAAWRTAWFYEYNYEKQFPYTPNIRGVRTDEWKFMRYPHGDGSPDRHLPELYNLKDDPRELRNLAADPAAADQRKKLEAEYERQAAAIAFKVPDFADRTPAPGEESPKKKAGKKADK